MKKRQLAKKAKGKKVVARRAAPRKQVARKVAPRKAASKKVAPEKTALELGAGVRAAGEEKLVDVAAHQPPGSHLDAPAAGPHPGAGHQSVVRSEVKS